ncbi:alpha/beta hydrolase [Bradyrhizobium sp.]|uniref:alpha/beta hydrolase n=1 Tax=Bradyrhizobium sp. TaxID=376 RepID=UPI003C4CD515
MKTGLVVCVLAAMMAGTSAGRVKAEGPRFGAYLIKTGLDDAPPSPPSPGDATAAPATSCAHVAFSRMLKYGQSEQNVLDVATADAMDGTPRPVLVFVVGKSFAADGAQSDPSDPLLEQAMCFAVRNGMVAVHVAYRLAPQAGWPAGARDVAAATSWVHENVDLFGGNHSEIVVVGYDVGAFHVASFLAHKELQETDSDVAGAVLLSGIYWSSADGGAGEQSYFGADTSKYADRSALPGLLDVDVPIVLAWSTADPPRLVTEAEKLKQSLCGAGHCPRTALLTKQDSPASVFGLDGSGTSVADRIHQLIGELETRGLP